MTGAMNTPCGSWGKVQIQPIRNQAILFWNTPCASWGIVQIQATRSLAIVFGCSGK